jgi:site-specific recombinase XerC
MKRKLAFADSREDEINAWLVRFGNRKRHTITREEVRRQIRDSEDEGFAASTIRHRMTALSTLYDVLDGDDAYNPVKGIKRPTEAEPKPDSRPPHIIIGVLDELWLRAAMHNRGWKTLARALVLAHTGMRPSQMMRLDPDLHIRSYLDDAVAMVEVPSGKGGRTHWKPLTTDGVALFDCSCASAHKARSRHRRSTSHGCWRATVQTSGASIPTSCATPTQRSSGALERTSRTFRNCSGTSHRRRRSDTRWWYLRSSSP